ncbi:hypothetical protein J0X15_16190 [Roseibium sp. CAU 1637]|uniref:Uncharacterized protein n=1 Tax=Roseibium limicola TaxID=2816037 RepID=A0A939EQQ4_9HYPH|nr:hypothetical protein [Roseibium limicola]MBO0346768.1 hypothetical protein [Roseibium limicola]
MSDNKNRDRVERTSEADARRARAFRDLDRVAAESETIGSSTFVRMAKRAQDHLGAADKAKTDPVEIWATRIGRSAGLIFALGLLIHLFLTYL